MTSKEQVTSRTCQHEGCGAPAVNVDGHYIVFNRRVRVWACDEHVSADPLREVDPPISVIAAMDAEASYREGMRKRYTQDQPPTRGESVKTFAPAGIGKVWMPPRAQSFHWGENPGDVDVRVDIPSARTQMIMRLHADDVAITRRKVAS